MSPTPHKSKQRSLHIDDEAWDILGEIAAEQRLTRSAMFRVLVLNYQRPAPRLRAADEPAAPITEARRFEQPRRPNRKPPAAAKDIVLPDDSVGEFKVDGGKVRGRRLKSDRTTGGLDLD